MGKEMNQNNREFDAFQIFEEIQTKEEAALPPLSQRRITDVLSFEEAPYYEIEYDADVTHDQEEALPSDNTPQEGQAVSFQGTRTGCEREILADRIPPQEQDEVRERFNRMRDIARKDRYLNFRSSKFYDQRMQRENSKTFYRQGIFMQDFEDEYEKTVPYSSYFPNYQMMGYDQLRTFFTWRTRVRQGQVEHISLSYAYLYIYELLNNIGVDSPEEGLGQLLFFWDAFRVYDPSVDKYVLRWLKDYHIYYNLPQAFPAFVEENGLEAYYPGLWEDEDPFESYCAISRYDIRKSAFYTAEREDMVRRCVSFTLDRLREALEEGGLVFDELLFQPARNMSVWVPFHGALFYPMLRQADRQVRLSRKEVYVCRNNQWTCSAMITEEGGRRLLGYVMKQTESLLRKLTGYKHKITANPDMLSPVTAEELKKAGISPERTITDAVRAFYKEETKTVVSVNPGMLEKIRQEAYVTQERLIVPEEESGIWTRGGNPVDMEKQTAVLPDSDRKNSFAGDAIFREEFRTEGKESLKEENFREKQTAYVKVEIPDEGKIRRDCLTEPGGEIQRDSFTEPKLEIQRNSLTEPEWEILRNSLTEPEQEALRIILKDSSNLKSFADGQGIMLEVLAEGINEKAADAIGDGLLDNEFMVYEDYEEQVKEMLGL